MTQQVGRFELADGSTIFLDEIGDLHLELQAKLLRVLQEGEFERLGSHRTIKVNVRVIAATNHDLAAMVKAGEFRADLFYRLNVFPVAVPPLRERRTDIPLLVWQFVRHFAEKMGKPIESIQRDTMDRLQQYPWPGNIRELRNLIERAVILSDNRTLAVPMIGGEAPDMSAPVTMKDAERQHILGVLERTGWRISGANGAAAQLGMKRTTLNSKLKKLGIARKKP
jgi:transcriptional regulator with GAF, ATPase, and Fis domain